MSATATQLSMFGLPTVTRCLRCGRQLTHPTSVQAGRGPVCRHSATKERK